MLGFGCTACRSAGLQTPFGKALLSEPRWAGFCGRFRKHEQCESHMAAVAEVTKCDACVAAIRKKADDSSSASEKDFKEVWLRRRQGGAARHEVAGCAGLKRQRMEWCLAEGMRMIDRAFVSTGGVLISHSDGKGKRLTMRFSA